MVLAFWFAKSGGVSFMISFFEPVPWLAAFLAGIGFSSLFTTAPATVALGSLGATYGPWYVAVCGGAGALVGDLVILKVMKVAASTATRPVARIAPSPRFLQLRRLRRALSHGPLKVLLWLVGGAIIASPLPDELGLAVLGLSKVSLRFLIPISYTFNTIGIALIGLVASSL